jgi:hypothetical protein
MTTATIEVDFANLNTLATNLRTAGAKFYVDKVDQLFRISVKEEPKLASVTDILNYTNNLIAEAKQTDSPVASYEITAQPAPIAIAIPVMATLEQLESVEYKQLKALAKTHAVTGYNKACQSCFS